MQADGPDSFQTETWLLAGLKNSADRKAWSLFVKRYQSLIFGTARRAGLASEDCEDAAQDTMLSFTKSYQAGKYDRERGHLKTWLFGIARNKIRQVLSERPRASRADIDLIKHEIMAPNYLEMEWEIEWRRAISRACLELVKSSRTNNIIDRQCGAMA